MLGFSSRLSSSTLEPRTARRQPPSAVPSANAPADHQRLRRIRAGLAPHPENVAPPGRHQPAFGVPLRVTAGWCVRWVTPSELSTAHTGTRLSHEMQTPPKATTQPWRDSEDSAKRSAAGAARRPTPPFGGASASGGLKRRSAPQSLALRANSLPCFEPKSAIRYTCRVSLYKLLICKQFSCKQRSARKNRKTASGGPPGALAAWQPGRR